MEPKLGDMASHYRETLRRMNPSPGVLRLLDEMDAADAIAQEQP